MLCMAGSSCVKEKLETIYNSQEDKIDKYISSNNTVQRTGKGKTPAKIDTTMTTDSIFDYICDEDGLTPLDSVLVRIDTTFRMDTTFRDTTWTDTLRVVYNSGSARLVKEEGTGPGLNAGGNVAFYYAGYVFNGSVSDANLFITNHQETAQKAKWTLTDADYQIYEVSMQDTEFIEGLRNGLMGVRTGETCEILFSGKYGFGNDTFGIIPANSALFYRIWVVAVSND